MAKRRAKGDGGLFLRGDGMWIGRVELPPGPDGSRRRKQVASRDFAVASAELRKLRADVDSGRIAVTASTTLAKWLDRWITEIHTDIRPTTRRDYRASIELHIKPAIGSKRLDKLTPDHVRQMHRYVGPRRAAEKAHVILQKALKDAVRNQMLTVNVADLVDKPKYRKGKRTSLAVPVAKTVLTTAVASCDESWAARWVAAFVTGGRQGELLGLTWDRVDLDHGLMNLDWQLQQLSQIHGCGPADAGGVFPCKRTRPGWCPDRKWDLPPDFEYEVCHRSLVWTRPKTAAGERHVPIIPPLLIMLRALAERGGPNPHNLVWHHPDGRPIGPRDDYRQWKALLERAGVITDGETLPLHVARHTTATLLRSAGVDEQTRMEIIGHATTDAQRIYAHADIERHRAAMSSLTELLA